MDGKSTKRGKIFGAAIPVLLIGVVVIMIIPIPSFFLDILLALNITISLVILFVALYTNRPLEFSSYPALLLLTTLFRLGMNISSTRLILLDGAKGMDAAGSVIQAFGTFVLGGNYVIGVIIFSIIMYVNLKVITAGSGRIAEVAARFTLDAMPGKQMAIDSELNNGTITEKAALKKRDDLSREAEFYGSMDGASKFVKGDAMAGIVITAINIFGGLFMAIVLEGMPWRKAAETFTLLTVGDGLVSQIPALIISVSAGIIVARAGSGQDLGTEVGSQLTYYARPLMLAAGVAGFFAFIPGLPFLPFVILSGATAAISVGAAKITQRVEDGEDEELLALEGSGAGALAGPPKPGSTEEVKSLLGVDLLELEVGYELVPMVDGGSGGDLIERIRSLRRQFALDLGFIVPPIHIRDNVRLEPTEYRLMLKGVQVARGTVKPHHHLAMNPGDVSVKIPGIPTKEPAFGLDALWIKDSDKERAQFAGYTVVDPTTVIITHITEVVKGHAHEIIGRQEVQVLVDNLSQDYPKLVEEVVPSTISLGTLQQVLSGLLREGVSIRDLRTILETLADWGPSVKSPERLIEHVRSSLGRSITAKHLGTDGSLSLVSLTPTLERQLGEILQVTESGSYLALEPSMAQRIINLLKKSSEKFTQKGNTPVLLAPSSLRSALFSFTERFIPGFVVLSHQEVHPSIKVKSLGVINGEE